MHTPGPWRLSNTISAYECKRRKIVASEDSPESGTGICEVYGIEDECNVANARLIAAAPDLLEALQRIVSHQDYIGGSMATMSPIRYIAMRAIEKAIGTDAAQTSARGETSE